ncbi:MAG: ABC transporter ATP-binding protein [Anaerorhabdus sp.]|uniref:ABC transporter ATP-binding protein n=1 Tax=Anaerorhabdus sp. TaxID=1872524 RepID=UPI002FC686C3
MKFFIQFIKDYKVKMIITLILLVGQIGGTLLIPKLVATMIDNGILKSDFNVVINVGISMLIFAILTTIISTIGSWVTSDLGSLFGREMRTKLFKKTQELSLQQFDSFGISSMITRSTSDITNLQQTLGMILQLVLPAPIILIVSIAMTASVNQTLALIQFSFIILLFFLSIYVIRKSNHLSSTIQLRLDRINKVVRESITGVRVIRAFGNENYEKNRCYNSYTSYANNMIKLNRLYAIFYPAVWLMMGAIMVVVLFVGGSYSLIGAMEIGEISAVIEYAILSMGYCIMAVSTLTTLPKAQACLNRLEEVLDLNPSITDLSSSQTTSKNTVAPVVEFNHVTFSYDGAEQSVINDLSFTMNPNETTAIIGSTGSGKSTIVDLLLRIHEHQTGTINLNGANTKIMTQEELRNQIGYVPQKAFLFSGTIRSNLLLANPTASEDELWQALAIAQAKDFVSSLDDGLDSLVSQGGSNFSGGQRQRLSIARALVKKTNLFIFDDCFSALDVKTDKVLRQQLHLHVHEQAKLIIAQRVSSILDADQILVLDQGHLVGKGKHHELLESCAIYRAIVDSQINTKEVTV